MLLRRTVISLILTAFLYGSSKATPHLQESYLGQRDDPASSSAAGGATLEPVVPPDVKQDDLATLTLDTQVRLAWAGSTTGATSRKRFKRDGAILTQADFTFKYPTVPIDHSSFITGVSCSSGILTGVLTDKAYAFARKQWAGVSDIVFVTSVDGCGLDNADEFFHAKSITFSDSNKSFSAKGSSARYKTITDHMNLKWGDIGTSNLKRAADQKDVRSHPSTQFPLE